MRIMMAKKILRVFAVKQLQRVCCVRISRLVRPKWAYIGFYRGLPVTQIWSQNEADLSSVYVNICPPVLFSGQKNGPPAQLRHQQL